MSSKLIRNALSEVIPSFQAEPPLVLINYIDSLYSLSTMKLPLKQQEEVARYHLCAVVAVERMLEKHNLPHPEIDQIPVAPLVAKRLIVEIRDMVNNKGGSPTKSRMLSPVKSRVSTPRTNRKSAVSTPTSSATRKLFQDPKTPTPSAEGTPTRRSRGRPPGALNRTTLEKMGQSPFQTASTIKVITPFLSPNKKKFISTPELISFCNKFQLPQQVTANVLHTFSEYHNRIKHEWALLCGLVALVYTIMHHDLINRKPSVKADFFDKLHSLQNGALLRQSLSEWINLIHEFFKDVKWVKQLKFEYGYFSNSNIEIPSMGNMLLVNPILQPEDEYQAWKQRSCASTK